MRLKKLSLIAAAGLAASVGALAATATLDDGINPPTPVSLSSNITVGAGYTLTIDAPDSLTFQNKFLATSTVSAGNAGVFIADLGGSGDIVKTGAGTLQIDSYSEINFFGGNTFLIGLDGASTNGGLLRLMSNANQGNLRITEGQVLVSGYLNQFVSWGVFVLDTADIYDNLHEVVHNRSGDAILYDGYLGFQSTILEGGALLDFQNTRRNVPLTQGAFGDGIADIIPAPTKYRINYVTNLKAGDNNDQNQTRLNTGDADMRLVVDIDTAEVGGVGIISGQGVIFKTGLGEFKVLNDSTFTGDFMVGGGTLTLASLGGASLATARSVNLLDNVSRNDAYADLIAAANSSTEYKPGYVPYAVSGAKLRIDGDQRISNFQGLFDTHSGSTDNFVDSTPDEPYPIRRGEGTEVEILAGSTLTLQQDLNGYYTGRFTGGGDLVKDGAGTLVLLGLQSTFGTLTVNEGSLISSVQMLGMGEVILRAGTTMGFVQNSVGTLQANISGDIGSTLVFSKVGTVTNIDGTVVTIGNGQIGSAEVGLGQLNFSGTVVVKDGLTLILSSPTGDTFQNAGIDLRVGDNGEESRLTFADTDQTFRELSGQAGTKIDLGRGTVTLVQGTNTTYSGKVTGVGGFIKDGAGRLTLDGRDVGGASVATYSGATTVKEGVLALTGANALTNTSGLILLGGSVSVTGDQTFGALFGSAGTTLAMGSGNLTIGLSDARLAALALEELSLGGTPLAGHYLGTEATETISATGTSYNAAATALYLESVGMGAVEAAELAFAGSITGSGDLIKQGANRLILTGVNTYTGDTLVNGGALQVNLGSIDASASVTVASGATFAVNVDSGSGTFDRVISGAGNFEKLGDGTLTLDSGAIAYTGSTLVTGGTLLLTLDNAVTGDLLIGDGATLALDLPADLTFAAAVGSVAPGDGTFQKDGVGTLHLTNSAGFTGEAVVNAGTLRVDTLTVSAVTVASGATFQASLSAPVASFTGVLTGSGTFAFSDHDVTFDAASPAFTGTVSVTDATLTAGADDLFPLASIALTNSVFDLDDTSQTIASFTGDATSSVDLGASGELHFAPALGVTATFDGQIVGTGSVVMDGAGTQRLASPYTGWDGTTEVNAGVLEATVAALGDSVVTVNAPGTLAFLNDTGTAATYASAIAGDGTIGKVGAGVVNLTNASVGFTGTIAVSEGELHVGSAGLGGELFGDTTVATGGIYALVMSANTAHNATLAGNHVADAAGAQHGSLAVEGAFTLTLLNGQSYTGNTILRGGATLDLVNSTGLSGVLNGLAGEAGTTVLTGGADLTIVQSVDGVFAGDFDAATDLTIQGDGKLSLDAAVGNIGAITVDGARLALDASSTHAVSLIDGGTLYFDTTNNLQVYAGTVTGDGNMIKTGTGTLSLQDAGDFSGLLGFTGGLGADEGRLEVSVAALLATAPNITQLVSEGSGEVAIRVDSIDGAQSLPLAITGDGALAKTGDGTLLLGDALNPYTVASTGTFTIEQGTLGGSFTTGGDLVVGAAGTLSPGNSPGTVNVVGDFVSAGVLDLELTGSNATPGVDYDRINVTGDVTLGAGTVFTITQFGPTAPVRGAGYTVLVAGGSITAAEGDFTVDLVGGRPVIIVTPSRHADTSSILFGKGAANAIVIYDTPSLSNFNPHEGLSGLIAKLDGFIVGAGALDPNLALGKPVNDVGAALAFAPTASLGATVAGFSPLGYASLYAMSSDTAQRQEDRLRERLAQRRYDRAGDSVAEWESFVVGSAGMADNAVETDTPTFDFKTYGGLVGLDNTVSEGLVVGGSAGYDNGTATLHQGGGKIEMNRVRGTAFMSTMLSTRWFLDAGLSAGFGDFSAKRDTALGRQTGSTTGFDLGANLTTGTVVAINESLHLTPFAGVSYTHYEFRGFTESGNAAALKLDGWSQDSLRASVGTGLGWWLPAGDWKWKLGVDTAFNHELLDTDSDLVASFATLGGGKFATKAAALPSDTISVGPNAALHFDEETSVSAGLTFEYGFDGRTYSGLNIAFRRRF